MNVFEIHGIRYGWFEVCFTPHGEKKGWLMNSDYLECDAPKLFLEALADILENKSSEEWLCWHDEPGAYILRISLEAGKVAMEIFTADKDALDLPYKGEVLAAEKKTLEYENTFEIKQLLDDVLVEFSLYENGNGLALYKKHWGEFPEKEFGRLKKIAVKFNNEADKNHKLYCLTY